MGRGEAISGQRGFTLLELIVALLVIALAVGFAVPAIGRSTESLRVRAEVAGFAAMLRHARERAIVTSTAQAEVRETRPLSERLTIDADPPPALTVRFEPQGGSNGGDFRVSSGTIVYRVTVDALTGRVRSVRQ